MFKNLFKKADSKKDDFPEELSFGTFFNYLLIKRKTLSIIVGVTVIVVLLYSFIAPFQYRAGATLLPPENSSGMGDLTSFLQTLSGGIALGGAAQGNKLLIFKDIFKSRELAKIVVDKNHLDSVLKVKPEEKEDLYGGISNMINVDLKRSGLMVVTAETSTPYFPNKKEKAQAAKLSALIVNSAIQALDSINRYKNTTKARRKREFIEKVQAQKQKELDRLDSLLEIFRTSHHLYALDEQNKAILNNAIALGTELAEAEVELNLKKLEFNDASPIVKSAQEKYNNLLEQYQRIQTGGLTAQDKFSIPLDSVPKLIREYQNLMRDKKILEQVNLFLATQKYQEAIQEASDVPTVEPLDLALVPKHRIAPKRKVMVLLAFFLSFVGGAVYLLILGIYNGNLIVKKEEKKDNLQE